MNHLIDMLISRDLQTVQNSDYFQCSDLGISGTVFWARSEGDRVKINQVYINMHIYICFDLC